jgi:hypothetical protein
MIKKWRKVAKIWQLKAVVKAVVPAIAIRVYYVGSFVPTG